MLPDWYREFKKPKSEDVAAENLLFAMTQFPQLNLDTPLSQYIEMLKFLDKKAREEKKEMDKAKIRRRK